MPNQKKHQILEDESLLSADSMSEERTLYKQSNFIGNLHYMFLNPFRKRLNSFSHPVPLDEMLKFNDYLKERVYDFSKEYSMYRSRGGTFFHFILRKFKPLIFTQLLCAFITLTVQILLSLTLKFLIIEITRKPRDNKNLYAWLITLSLLLLLLCYSNNQFFTTGVKLGVELKYSIIKLINHKIFELSNFRINQISKAKLFNIVNNDTAIIDTLQYYAPYPILAPFFMVLHIIVFWLNFGPVSLIGVSGTFIFWPWLVAQAKITQKYIDRRNAKSDNRIGLVKEFVEKIRFIKMSGQLDTVIHKIEEIRQQEDSNSHKIGFLSWGTTSITKLSPIVSSLPMFFVYHLTGGQLTLDKVFMALLLLNYTKLTLVSFTQSGITFITEFKAICKRCEEVLDVSSSKGDEKNLNKQPKDSENAVEFKNFSGWWTDSKDGQHTEKVSNTPVVKNLDFCIKKGTLTMILGRVGSGKSSVMSAILQELPQIQGEIRVEGSIATVEQEPLIFSGTVRENIVFGRPFDESRYRKTLHDCCLVHDINSFHKNDQTLIGESGYSLSGGQKARICIARAVYSNADFLMLDDPLSALDANVAQQVYDNTIRESLQGKTIVMITNNWQLAPYADKIIILESGGVKAEGDYHSLKDLIEPLQNASRGSATSSQSLMDDVDTNEKEQARYDSNNETDLKLQEVVPDNIFSASLDLISFKFIRGYLSTERSFTLKALLIIFSGVIEVGFICYGVALGSYIQRGEITQHEFEILGLDAVIICVVSLVRGVIFSWITIRIASRFHNQMLHRISKTCTTFFDTTQAGDIINKFSSDVGVLEKSVPFNSYFLLDGFFFFFSMLVALWIIQPLLVIHGLILGLVTWASMKAYIRVVIMARSLEIQTRGPLYGSFNENLSGIVVLRTYGMDIIAFKDFIRKLSENKTCTIACRFFSQAFGFWLEFWFVIVNAITIALLVAYSDVQPFLLSLSITYLLQWGDYAQFSMKQVSEVLVQMGSVQRIMKNLDTPLEKDFKTSYDSQLPDQWPQHGKIEFCRAFARYREDLPLVIKDLSFEIKPGEKVACVGRTGAGKSSITQVLFRMIELDTETQPESKIIVDGIDIAQVGLQKLRHSFSLIAQVPTLLTGSIRDNIDPESKHSDEMIWQALRDVSLEDHVKSLHQKLCEPVNDDVTLFSAGQKQLMSLARVMINRSKVVVLDEATSLIDQETDEFMQKILFEKLRDCTVFNIAHRLSTIAGYDRVIVMESGEIAEYGSPYELLVDKIGDTKMTRTEGAFVKLVKSSGEVAERVFHVARKAYFVRNEAFNSTELLT